MLRNAGMAEDFVTINCELVLRDLSEYHQIPSGLHNFQSLIPNIPLSEPPEQYSDSPH
jgi:hypothetical protein